MPTFKFSDITPAGAYINALEASRESGRRNAGRPFETGQSHNVLKSLRSLVQRIATASALARTTHLRTVLTQTPNEAATWLAVWPSTSTRCTSFARP